MSNKNYVTTLMLLCAFASSASAESKDDIDNIKNKIGDIQDSLSQSQDTMQFVRSVSGSTFVPEPKHSKDMPSYSYFTIESYDIFSSPSGKRMIQAVITNNSGGGIKLKTSQTKRTLVAKCTYPLLRLSRTINSLKEKRSPSLCISMRIALPSLA